MDCSETVDRDSAQHVPNCGVRCHRTAPAFPFVPLHWSTSPPLAHKMANIDSSSPQLAVVKNLLESYMSLDTKNIEPLLSKNYLCQRFPRSSELPDETRKTHLEAWGSRLALMEKFEVGSIQRRRNRPQNRRLTSAILRSFVVRRLKHPEKLSSWFVPLYKTVTLSQTITHNRDLGLNHVSYPWRGQVLLRYRLHLHSRRRGRGTQDPQL